MLLCARLVNSLSGRLRSNVFAVNKMAITPRCGRARGRSACATAGDRTQLVFLLPSEQATQDLAATLCASRQLGDCYLIHGTLGAGKSAFCRAFIRYASGDEEMPVPSPTYLLLNTYEEDVIDGPPIHHLDLYRLSEASSEMRLDIPHLLATGTALFEWPDRLSTHPKRYMEMQMYPLRPETSHDILRKARGWLTGVSAPQGGTGHDLRWRLVCIQGVGIPLSKRYAEGRNDIKLLGLQPEYIKVPPSDALEIISLCT